MGSAYFRFSPHMAVDVELDEKDDKILVDLMWSTMAYVHQVGILANCSFAFFVFNSKCFMDMSNLQRQTVPKIERGLFSHQGTRSQLV